MEFDYVWVVELVEVDDFSIGALCVDGVLEGVEDLFEGQCLIGFSIEYFPDVSVGS